MHEIIRPAVSEIRRPSRLGKQEMTRMQIKNCTPHTLIVHLADGTATTLEPSGTVPRVATITEQAEPLGDIPVVVSRKGEITGLPDPEPNVFLVVSQIVAAACDGRSDVLFPGELIRDESGRPIGCRGLARHASIQCCKCDDTGAFEAGDFGGSLAKCHCKAGERWEAEIQKIYNDESPQSGD